MRLNVQTDYALRLLMHLGVNEGRLVTIAKIAKQFGISKNHLMKVANSLGRERLIETVRGRSGGLRLLQPASAICVGDVVRKMEGDFALVECFLGDKGCCLITPACRLQNVIADAMVAFLAVLDQHTLEDLIAHNSGLRSLLAEDAA